LSSKTKVNSIKDGL